jgi:hypothetical protein
LSRRKKRTQSEGDIKSPHQCQLQTQSLKRGSQESGYGSETELEQAHQQNDYKCQERFPKSKLGSKGMDKHMICLQSFVPAVCQKILSIKFLTEDAIVLMMDNNSVHIYDIPSNTVIHDIRLTHPICSIDVWNDYLLIGSSVVHIVDTREDHWRRITVIDMDDNESLKNPSQHFAIFNCTGEFVTASSKRNKLSLWPQPLESGELMTNKKAEFSGGSDMELISGLLTAKHGDSNVLLALGKGHNGNGLINIIQWGQEQTVIHTLNLSESVEICSLSVTADGRKISAKAGNQIKMWIREGDAMKWNQHTEIGLQMVPKSVDVSCMSYRGGDMLLGYNDGRAVVFQKTTILPTENLKMSSPVTAIAAATNSSYIAVGFGDGQLHICGESKETFKAYIKLAEKEALTVYMPGTFSKQSLLSDITSHEVDCNQQEIDCGSNTSLFIPEGAIAEDQSITIHTGLLWYGAEGVIKTPADFAVLSPIVWLHSEPEATLHKPLTLKMEHCARDTTCASLVSLKGIFDDDLKSFQFEPTETLSGEKSTESKIDGFCVHCVGTYNKEDTDQAEFAIVPVEKAYDHGVKTVIFCVCHHLDRCTKTVKEQYTKPNHMYTVYDPVPIVRTGMISVDYSLSEKRWTIANKTGRTEISSKELDFWTYFETPRDLVKAHQENRLPPRFVYEITPRHIDEKTSDKARFDFIGCQTRDGSTPFYEVILSQPREQSPREY